MKKMSSVLVFSALVLSSSVFAKTFEKIGAKNLSITPIVGFERVQKFEPTPTMKTRFIYGAILVYPLPLASAELEYTHAKDNSFEPTTQTSYKDDEDKVKLGIRGSFGNKYISTYLRAGGQARQNTQEKTVAGVTTTTKGKIEINPYAGTGISFAFADMVSANADLTAVYRPSDKPELKDFELQPSVGLSIRF